MVGTAVIVTVTLATLASDETKLLRSTILVFSTPSYQNVAEGISNHYTL